MGWAARCLRNLFCLGKEKECSNSSKEKERWDLDGSCNVGQIPAATEASWLGNYFSETEKEQSKHTIVVAAADAAVAAAQASVAVVRLTSHRRGTMFGADQGRRATVKIQIAFRGYFARKALPALKGPVKLQAHVRGHLVRRRAAQTLQSMQALIRAQATVQMQKGQLPNEDCRRDLMTQEVNTLHLFTTGGCRHLLKRPSTLLMRAKTVEIDTCRSNSRAGRTNPCMCECSEDRSLFRTLSSPLP